MIRSGKNHFFVHREHAARFSRGDGGRIRFRLAVTAAFPEWNGDDE